MRNIINIQGVPINLTLIALLFSGLKYKLCKLFFTYLESVIHHLSKTENIIKFGFEMTELWLLEHNGRFFTWTTNRVC